MNYSFFKPIATSLFQGVEFQTNQIGYRIQKQKEKDFETASVCLIGIEYDHKPQQADIIRRALYGYYRNNQFPQVFDLGNIFIDDDFDWRKEEFFSLLNQCLERNMKVCFLGGESSFLYYIQEAFTAAKKYSNIGVIDKKIQIGQRLSDEITNDNYIVNLLAQQPNYLFNYVGIGYQNYLVDYKSIELLKQLNFEEIRLGRLRDNIKITEPYIRDLDILGLSTEAIKQAETGGQPTCSPNGLYAEEVAQIMRYAGLSETLKCIGFFDYNSLYDSHGICAHLLAQSIWCFLEGMAMQPHEYPEQNEHKFMKYIVHNKEMDLDLIFLKSNKTDRWWIEMPEDKALLKRRFFMPCSYEDYEIALDGDVPERWIKGFNKLKQPE